MLHDFIQGLRGWNMNFCVKIPYFQFIIIYTNFCVPVYLKFYENRLSGSFSGQFKIQIHLS